MKTFAPGILMTVAIFAIEAPSSANVLYNLQTNYSEARTTINCGTSNTCLLAFHKVAAGKTLLVTHVSCRIAAKSTAAPLTRAVLIDNTGQVRESLTPLLISTDGENVQYFQSSNEASSIFGAPSSTLTTPQISVTFDGSIPIQELSCSLAGQYL